MKLKLIIATLISIAFISSCSDKKRESDKTPAPNVRQYQLAKVQKASVSETIKLPAQLTAYEEVSIFPKVNGYVKSVLVDIGSHVKKGQLLMELEAPELEQASIQAREKYARAKSDFMNEKENYERLKQASLTAGAISPQDLASAKAKMDADSALSNAESANWQLQETMRSYLRIIAPFEGVITERNIHPGALVSNEAKDNKPMLELKQIRHLRLQVDVPEGISSALRNNDTIFFSLSAFPGKKLTGNISRKSQNINMQYRTERIEIDVLNKDDVLSPGMYADVYLNAKGNTTGFSVPKPAIVTSTEGKYVLAVRDGKAYKVDVITGNESADRIEVFGQLQPGTEVIMNANDEIKEGTIVQ